MKVIIKNLTCSVLIASIILCCTVSANAEEYELITHDVEEGGTTVTEPAIAHTDDESGDKVIDPVERIIHTGDSVEISDDMPTAVLNIYIENNLVETLEHNTEHEKWTYEDSRDLMYNALNKGSAENRAEEGASEPLYYYYYHLYFKKMARNLYGGDSDSNNNNNDESHSDSSSTATAVAEPVTQVAVASSEEIVKVAPAYAMAIETATPGTTVSPVNAATVNYANLAAKLLVGPSAVVYQSAVVSGNSKDVTLSVSGLSNGQKVTVLAYDLNTGMWKKISATVKNGNVTFNRGNSTIFSIVVDVLAP